MKVLYANHTEKYACSKKKSPYRVQDLHGKGKENEISFPEER